MKAPAQKYQIFLISNEFVVLPTHESLRFKALEEKQSGNLSCFLVINKRNLPVKMAHNVSLSSQGKVQSRMTEFLEDPVYFARTTFSISVIITVEEGSVLHEFMFYFLQCKPWKWKRSRF